MLLERLATLTERLTAFAQHPQIRGYRHVAQAEPADFLIRPAVVQGADWVLAAVVLGACGTVLAASATLGVLEGPDALTR